MNPGGGDGGRGERRGGGGGEGGGTPGQILRSFKNRSAMKLLVHNCSMWRSYDLQM